MPRIPWNLLVLYYLNPKHPTNLDKWVSHWKVECSSKYFPWNYLGIMTIYLWKRMLSTMLGRMVLIKRFSIDFWVFLSESCNVFSIQIRHHHIVFEGNTACNVINLSRSHDVNIWRGFFYSCIHCAQNWNQTRVIIQKSGTY